jgi:hypothetical protein
MAALVGSYKLNVNTVTEFDKCFLSKGKTTPMNEKNWCNFSPLATVECSLTTSLAVAMASSQVQVMIMH